MTYLQALEPLLEKSTYFERYAEKATYILTPPSSNLSLSVVIPCHREPKLLATLESLKCCTPPNGQVEVIIVVNHAENASQEVIDQNEQTVAAVHQWILEQPQTTITWHLIYCPDLPKKHAGVGLARKIGMDEAAKRFNYLQKDGIIVCFDADSLCKSNYLHAIEQHFQKHPESPGCSIHYEHPLEGDYETGVYEGIKNYELHLRYYIDALGYAGFIHAHQTIGSSMAVKTTTYTKQGGMNKRKAGEDFYFLHKIIPLGNFTKLTSTTVIPSPRRSDRVPFGTGKAINDWLANSNTTYSSYAWKSFEDLKVFLIQVDYLSTLTKINAFIETLPEAIKAYLEVEDFGKILPEIQRHGKSKEAFRKRFFQWFDGFRAMKYIHFARDHFYPDEPLEEVAHKLWQKISSDSVKHDVTSLLLKFRAYDKNN